jgi:hypothetical protein
MKCSEDLAIVRSRNGVSITGQAKACPACDKTEWVKFRLKGRCHTSASGATLAKAHQADEHETRVLLALAAREALRRTASTPLNPNCSCSSARAIAPRFFQAPPRGECYFALALRYHFTSIGL